MDSRIAERIRACKEEQFPLCLKHAIENIFTDSEPILMIERRMGFENDKPVASSEEVWQKYLDFLASLEEPLGRDVVAVIEYRILQEIEKMQCQKCPIYELELGRSKTHFSNSIPSSFSKR
jgi:hypothetical protein